MPTALAAWTLASAAAAAASDGPTSPHPNSPTPSTTLSPGPGWDYVGGAWSGNASSGLITAPSNYFKTSNIAFAPGTFSDFAITFVSGCPPPTPPPHYNIILYRR